MALALFSGVTFDSPRKANGEINAGGKVYFYEPGTSTPKNAYTTSQLDVETANPLILDAYGMGTAWLNGAYKIRVTDSADVLIPNGEEDNYNKGSSFDITAVTAARTMVGLDDTASFTHNGTYTASLTQASTLGAGWFTDHYNIGTGVITFARLAAGDTIDGTAANFTLQPGEFVRITVNSGTTGFVSVITKRDLYAVASGTDTYTCTFAPPISALYSGQKLRVRFTNANATTTPTLNANAIGAKTIKKEGSAALVAGDIPAGHEAELIYNGTDFILGNPKWPSTVPLGRTIRAEGFASSAAVDLGTVNVGDFIHVTGVIRYTVTAGGGEVLTSAIKNGTCVLEDLPGIASIAFIRSTHSPTATAAFQYINISGYAKVITGGTCSIDLITDISGTTGFTVASRNVRAFAFNNG